MVARKLTVAEIVVIGFVADCLAVDSRGSGVSTEHGDLQLNPERRRAMVALSVELYERIGQRTCRACACTNQIACKGGCRWVGPNLCSSCDSRKLPRVRGRRG